MSAAQFNGPLEAGQFPEKLTARVVTSGPVPRVHGYDVESDLAHHYGATDLLLLSLTGELPAPPVRAAFEVAWLFLAPVSVAHAGPHASVLARLCGATASSTVAVAAIGLAEQARALLAEHDELLNSLRSGAATLPERYQSFVTDEREAVERLRLALRRTGLSVPALQQSPTRDAALLSVLFACGLRQPEQLQAVVVLARMPSALAEGFAERATNFANYPINLPPYVYEESR
jgi:hypothetical protein